MSNVISSLLYTLDFGCINRIRLVYVELTETELPSNGFYSQSVIGVILGGRGTLTPTFYELSQLWDD